MVCAVNRQLCGASLTFSLAFWIEVKHGSTVDGVCSAKTGCMGSH